MRRKTSDISSSTQPDRGTSYRTWILGSLFIWFHHNDMAIWIGACDRLFLGLILAILRQYGGWIFSRVATGYIEIIRGTPLLAQLLLFYYLPTNLNIPITA